MASAAAPRKSTIAWSRTNRLEDMVEPQEWNEAFAAERQVEAGHERLVAVDAEADAVGDVEVAQGEIVSIGRDHAGVHEQGGVERPPGFPPVLGGHRQAVLVAEAEFAEAAQRLAAAERRL